MNAILRLCGADYDAKQMEFMRLIWNKNLYKLTLADFCKGMALLMQICWCLKNEQVLLCIVCSSLQYMHVSLII
jgi:hypothetical protein